MKLYIIVKTCVCISCCVAYKDLPDRKEQRQAAWQFPGWDECVVRTGNFLNIQT